jgi:HemY protein
MTRLLLLFALLVLLAFGFTWMADQPGSLSVTWLGYRIEEIPVYLAIGLMVLAFFVMWFAWWVIRLIFGAPGAVGGFFRGRRSRKGIEALSKGMVAVSAGDAATAQKQAVLAKRLVSDSPLAHLLEAQAAQLRGDNTKVSQIYGKMLDDPETELVALRGLYVAARKAGDEAAARGYAERAHRLDTSLAWASTAVGGYLSNEHDWPAVANLVDSQRRAGIIERAEANARRAVVLTAQAMAVEEADPDAAIDLAVKAHKLDASLVPAAVVAGRALAAKGALRRASKILEKTWRLSPHPDIAEVYVHCRAGDSAQDRLGRMKELLRVSDGGVEGAVALAHVFIDVRDWTGARKALEPFTAERPSVRLCLLLADIEEGEFGDHGRAREWLGRAARAPRDPAWTADGFVSEQWQPVSPVSGELGKFAWKVPLTAIGAVSDEAGMETIAAAVEEPVEEVSEAPASEAEAEVAEAVEPLEAEEVAGSDPETPAEEKAEPEDVAPEEAEEKAEETQDAVEPVEEDVEPEPAQEPDRNAARDDGTEPVEQPDADKPEEVELPGPVDAVGEKNGEQVGPFPGMRQPDDPGPRKTGNNGKRKSWFG